MEYDLGFLGGGQLARMSILAAEAMGFRCLSLDTGFDTPASQVAAALQGDSTDGKVIARVFRKCDRVTLENEFIRASEIESALRYAARDQDAVTPSVRSLGIVQDKLGQRYSLLQAGVPSPRAVALEGDGSRAVSEIGFPMVIKKRFGGYDGKGIRYSKTAHEFEALRRNWGGGEWRLTQWMAEEFVPFRRELAAMVMVGRDGNAAAYPTVETVQKGHVCDIVMPADIDAAPVALAAVRAVNGTGLFGVEMFELENGEILVNELAPRPHNSGHYTLDWGGPSQFENHVRLAMGLPFSPPVSNGMAVMANLMGQDGAGDFRAGVRAALEVPGVHVHWYGKAEARPGRKMGHLNASQIRNEPVKELVERAVEARERFYRAWTS